MSFEEALPSLVGNWKSAKSFPGSYIVVPVLEVNRSCLDKQRVREAITKMWEDSSSYEEFKKEVFYWLEELGP